MEITKDTVLRAWKDEEFRASLSPQERDAIPARPTGEGNRELSDAELDEAAGGIIGVIAAGIGIAAGSIGAGYGTAEILD